MKKLLLGTTLFTLAMVVPVSTMAAVDISIGISLPPPVVFEAPPEVIPLPDANNVYVVPQIDVDLFFWNGWWWRLWEGRWYRSYYYDRGWAYYNRVPSFYFDVDPGWRGYYRDHNWYGHRWNYERIPYRRLQQNWRSWHNDRRWEKRGTWGVEGYKSRPQPQRQEIRHQREQEYRQRPEVQQHQQWRQEQQKQQQQRKQKAQQPKTQQGTQQQRSQPQGQQHQEKSQHRQSQGKPEGGDSPYRK